MGNCSSVPYKAPQGSVIVAGTEDVEAGKGAIRRHPAATEENGGLKPYYFEDATTLWENFQRGVRLSKEAGGSKCHGVRPMDAEGNAGDFVWETYEEVDNQVALVGSALEELGLAPANDDEEPLRMIGIYSKNRPEWVKTELAAYRQNVVVVSLYDTLGPDVVAYVLGQTGIRTVFAFGEAEVASLREAKTTEPERCERFTHIVSYDAVKDEERLLCEARGLTLLSFASLLETGKEHPHDATPPTPEDIASVVYTSGTTGDPKGALLTHGNCIADASSAYVAGVNLGIEDVHLSYLPLAHMFERIVQTAGLGGGCAFGYFQGDTRKIISDLQALRPTIFPSVPRLWNRIYDKITQGVEAGGGVKAKLFHKAYAAKEAGLAQNQLTHGLWDKLVFSKVKGRVGLDRVRLAVSGSAPLAAHVMEFLRILLSCPVIEGYGQTETAAAASVTALEDQATLGHVGGPLVCNEIRLESVEEMGYLITDNDHRGILCEGRGEICFRGPNIFRGYYKMPEKTAEALDADGWLHSGDIGLWDSNGNLRIIDRKKNIFKLSQGEYVAAEKIENVYARSPFVGQVFVYGDSFQSYLVGVVVPDEEYLATWAKTHGKAGKSFAELVADAEVKDAILKDMKARGEDAKLKGFEKIKALHLDAEVWSVDNNLLTPTFKSKRQQLRDHYGDNISAMYAGSAVAGKTNLAMGAGKTAAAGGGDPTDAAPEDVKAKVAAVSE